MLDNGTSSLGVYAIYNSEGVPLRALIYNSQYFDGASEHPNMTVTLTGLNWNTRRLSLLRLSASAATARTDNSTSIAIGGHGTFANDCALEGRQDFETVVVFGGQTNITVSASEAVIAFF